MPESQDKPVERPSGPRAPAMLAAGYLLFQLLLLAWSAFPAATMRFDQPLESWLFLAGGQALFISWLWPTARRAAATWGRAAVEAVLVAAASVPPLVTAALWCDVNATLLLPAGGYLLAWLAAGAVASVCPCRLRWVYSLVLLLANAGLLGLGYLRLDFLGGDPTPLWRFSPMAQASRLAESGWLSGGAEQAAFAAPVLVLVILLAASVLRRPASPSAT